MKTFNKEVEDCIQKLRYNEAAELVAQRLGLEWTVNFLKNDKHFEDDETTRDIYTISLTRGSRNYTFEFGQSVMESQYYQDKIQGRTYTLSGGCRTGNYSINDIDKYKSGSNNLTLVKGEEPSLYDVLACLTTYDPGTFEDFCSEFGYDEDSRKAYNTYTAVKEEYMNMCSLFNDEELELLSLIN
jgi:hypothetical protein